MVSASSSAILQTDHFSGAQLLWNVGPSKEDSPNTCLLLGDTTFGGDSRGGGHPDLVVCRQQDCHAGTVAHRLKCKYMLNTGVFDQISDSLT